MDRRLGSYIQSNDTVFNYYHNLYSHRHHKWMYRHSSSNGNSKFRFKCISKFTNDLPGKFNTTNCIWSNKLYMDRRLGINLQSNDTGFNDYYNLYSHRHHKWLYRHSSSNDNGETESNSNGEQSEYL